MASTSDRPTLRTIAEMTGLAVTTVSRALSGAPQIALETRRRVRRVADEIGYQPDRAAQRLRTGRTNVISLVLDPHDEILGFSTSLIRGLTEALRDTQYHLVITPHFAETSALDPIRYILKNRTADGVVFSRTAPFDKRVQLLLEHDFPFVSHGRTDLSHAHPFVDYDNAAFAAAAARRLIAKGRRKLAIILPPDRFTFCQHLRYGFLSVVRSEGIAWEIAEGASLDSSSMEIYDWAKHRLGEDDAPDGFICPGEVSALSIMAALSDLGLAESGRTSIVAKQTSRLYEQVRPRVDVIHEDIAQAGELLGQLLLRRIAGENAVDLQVLQEPVAMFSSEI